MARACRLTLLLNVPFILVAALAGCTFSRPTPQWLELSPAAPAALMEIKVYYNGVPTAEGLKASLLVGLGTSQHVLIAQSLRRPIGGSSKPAPDFGLIPRPIPAGTPLTDLGARMRVEWGTVWTHRDECEVVFPAFTPKPNAVYLCSIIRRRRYADGCTATLYEKAPANKRAARDFVTSKYSRNFKLLPIATASGNWT